MAVDTSQFRNGLKIELDGEPFTMIFFQHVKPGKGGAFVRTKVKNLKTGRVLDRTFRAGERVEEADVEERTMQYLYQDGENYVFMDTQSYDQLPFTPEQVGDARKFLKENLEVSVVFWRGQPIGVELPSFIEASVTQCDAPVWSLRAKSGRVGTPALLQPSPVEAAMWHVWHVKYRTVPSW